MPIHGTAPVVNIEDPRRFVAEHGKPRPVDKMHVPTPIACLSNIYVGGGQSGKRYVCLKI